MIFPLLSFAGAVLIEALRKRPSCRVRSSGTTSFIGKEPTRWFLENVCVEWDGEQNCLTITLGEDVLLPGDNESVMVVFVASVQDAVRRLDRLANVAMRAAERLRGTCDSPD